MAATVVPDLTGFLLNSSIPVTLKCTALKYALGLSATEEGIQFLCQHKDFLVSIHNFALTDDETELCETAHMCLLNISSSSVGVNAFITILPRLCEWLLSSLFNLESHHTEIKCQILANMTRYEMACRELSNIFHQTSESFGKLIFIFLSSNSEVCSRYNYLSLVFGNLSSVPQGKSLFSKNDCLRYLLTFTSHESETRRMGIAILLKNICFDIDQHKWLLEEMDILPALLLPLAGPEEFSDDENEKLPLDLQYLESCKQHEPNYLIRIVLLEALLKLCSTRYGRKFLRDKGAYYILRELHLWDQEVLSRKVCDDVIEILIREESDINADNLMDLNIPQHFVDKFEQLSVSPAQ